MTKGWQLNLKGLMMMVNTIFDIDYLKALLQRGLKIEPDQLLAINYDKKSASQMWTVVVTLKEFGVDVSPMISIAARAGDSGLLKKMLTEPLIDIHRIDPVNFIYRGPEAGDMYVVGTAATIRLLFKYRIPIKDPHLMMYIAALDGDTSMLNVLVKNGVDPRTSLVQAEIEYRNLQDVLQSVPGVEPLEWGYPVDEFPPRLLGDRQVPAKTTAYFKKYLWEQNPENRCPRINSKNKRCPHPKIMDKETCKYHLRRKKDAEKLIL
jgi:hypothetical protein